MRSNYAACFVFLFLAINFSAPLTAQEPKPEDPPWIKEVAPPRIVYSVPGMKKVGVKKNLVYKSVAGEKLLMDVYSPAKSKPGNLRPAVVFIHGGRIPANLLTKPKEWGGYVSFGELVAASGFVGVTFNQRFYSWENLSMPQSDLNDAIAYIRSNAESLGIDKERICLWALSAGGLLLGRPLREAPSYIRCLVAYYPILDMRFLRKSIPDSVSDESLKAFSPVDQLGQTSAPIFIARAGRDDAGLNATIDRFAQAALAKNIAVDLSNHPDGQHGFEVLDDNKRTHEIIRRTLEFIKSNL